MGSIHSKQYPSFSPGRGVEPLLPMTPLKKQNKQASTNSRSLPLFQKRLETNAQNNMLNFLPMVTFYHSSPIHLTRVPLIQSGYKAHQSSSSGLLSSLFC